MAALKNKLTILLLCALVAAATAQAPQGGPHVSQGGAHASQGGAHESQGGPHENQGRAKRQVENGQAQLENGNESWPGQNWTTCDFITTSKLSCHDCNTRVVCTPVGGKLLPCSNPLKPHCNNGLCSFSPAEGC